MSRYVMALDQGTTSSRAILFDRDSAIAAVDQIEFTQHFPKPGWVEHDAEEIWRTQLRAAQNALAKAGASGSDVAAIGITNQRETTVVWDRASGQPIHRGRVAVAPDGADLRGAARARARRGGARAHRPGDRRVLLGHEGSLHPRRGARSARARTARRARVR